jgi:hypothetical protein
MYVAFKCFMLQIFHVLEARDAPGSYGRGRARPHPGSRSRGREESGVAGKAPWAQRQGRGACAGRCEADGGKLHGHLDTLVRPDV